MILSDTDRARIVEAIREAELRTSGEIYCVLTAVSSSYRIFPLAWSAAIALFVPLPLIYLTSWPALVVYTLQLMVFLGMLYLLTRRGVRYRIVPRQVKRERAHQEALRQFASHGLQHTQARTGVLIFVSVAERYAEVLADAGIAQKVATTVWDEAIQLLIAGIAAGRPADGLVATIEKCAAVLSTHFPPGAINRNELPNAIVELSPLGG
jgi:putative membrane protein